MALKERDIEGYYGKHGFEGGTKRLIHEQAGEIRHLEKTLIELSRQLDQMAALMGQFVTVAGNMKAGHERVLRMMPSDDDQPRPTDDRKLS